MQSVSSRIWTRVAVSISYDDNHYTTGTSKIYLYILTKDKEDWSVSLFNLHGLFNGLYINLHGLFNAKAILEEEQQWYD